MIFVRRLIWDIWNIEHISRHGVSSSEVEEVCHNFPLVREGYKHRIVVFGSTIAGRILVVILEPTKDSGVYYPVTAYESRKARGIYQKEKGGEAA